MTTKTPSLVPHLWFDKVAGEAAEFYCSLFPDSGITGKTTLSFTPSGDVDIIPFKLWGSGFMAINGGPLFTFNPAVSLFVYCGSGRIIEKLYQELATGGKAIMPLDNYPWSERYAWVQDRYGLTWQLDIDDIRSPQKITPSLLFVNEKNTLVREAITWYTGIFPGSRILMEAPYDQSAGLPEGTLLFAQFSLGGYLVNAMSSTLQHDYDFNEAVSLMVYCDTQDEIDYYWKRLTDGGKEQPCGWVKDKFGVSWQIIPAEMDTMMRTADKEQLENLTKAMLQMGKLDLEKLRQAFNRPVSYW
jgi:predicted 3-demethylubiquinone-9 3-methyltransferase (glyoxalase superfamily)